MHINVLAAPKKFSGKTRIIQDNAVRSWIRSLGRENILLLGDNDTEENCHRLGVQFARPELSESGVPLLNSILNIGREYGDDHEYMMYINSDIILPSNFLQTVQSAIRSLGKKMLLVGRRTNLDIEKEIDFSDKETEAELQRLAVAKGQLAAVSAIDYFVFPKSVFKDLPPLRIGRAGFDNMIIYWAKKQERIVVVDGTEDILAIHQNHDYSHVPGGKEEVFCGADAAENLKIMGGRHRLFYVTECDRRLSGGKIKRNHGFRYYGSKRYIFEVLPALHPTLQPLISLRKKISLIRNRTTQ